MPHSKGIHCLWGRRLLNHQVQNRCSVQANKRAIANQGPGPGCANDATRPTGWRLCLQHAARRRAPKKAGGRPPPDARAVSGLAAHGRRGFAARPSVRAGLSASPRFSSARARSSSNQPAQPRRAAYAAAAPRCGAAPGGAGVGTLLGTFIKPKLPRGARGGAPRGQSLVMANGRAKMTTPKSTVAARPRLTGRVGPPWANEGRNYHLQRSDRLFHRPQPLARLEQQEQSERNRAMNSQYFVPPLNQPCIASIQSQ